MWFELSHIPAANYPGTLLAWLPTPTRGTAHTYRCRTHGRGLPGCEPTRPGEGRAGRYRFQDEPHGNAEAKIWLVRITGGSTAEGCGPLLILEFSCSQEGARYRNEPELVDFVDKSLCMRTTFELVNSFSVFCPVFDSSPTWVLENVVIKDRAPERFETYSNDGSTGLSRWRRPMVYADVAGEFCLAHLASGEPERPNRICDIDWFGRLEAPEAPLMTDGRVYEASHLTKFVEPDPRMRGGSHASADLRSPTTNTAHPKVAPSLSCQFLRR